MKANSKYKIRTIVCAYCNREATDHFRPNQRFCSQECYQAAPRPRRSNGKNVPCEYCGETFYLIESRAIRAGHYFCCLEHQIAWQGRNKDTYTCKICGKAFQWSPSRKSQKVIYCSLDCRDADPDRRAMLIEMNAAQQRGNQSAIERIGYGLLDSLGAAYLPQHVIGGKFCVDAFMPDIGLVIQFDGDYWHGNPDLFPEPDSRQQKRMRLDVSQDAYMQACGYQVVRIWEHELHKSSDAVKTRLIALLTNRH